jgi:lipopolysaccharide/colanic/teichoic acid biosynthesis glycosyltransferase
MEPANNSFIDILQSGTTGIPAIAVSKVQEPLLKRPLDVILSLFMMILSVPFSLIVVFAIKLEDGGPIFYRQERWGKGGARFWAYKFRTMIPNSDDVFGIKQARKDDPRITSVGRFLRASGLDELPQILNIFKGEMSFVGPRALAVGEILYDESGLRVDYEKIPDFWRRLSVRPGLTGISTIYKAKDISPRKKFRYDLLYIRKQSLWLDLRLIAMSFWISFRGKWEDRGKKI